MFSNKEKTEESKSSYANLPSGSQYAMNFNMVMNFADKVAKSINQHLVAHPGHKVVTMATSKEMGTVVVFEVK